MITRKSEVDELLHNSKLELCEKLNDMVQIRIRGFEEDNMYKPVVLIMTQATSETLTYNIPNFEGTMTEYQGIKVVLSEKISPHGIRIF